MMRLSRVALSIFVCASFACGDNRLAGELSISGRVFDDQNGNGFAEEGEPPLVNVAVYLDANNNEVRDAEEVSTQTDNAGYFSIDGLAPGSYTVRQDLGFGWRSSIGGVARVVEEPPNPSIIGGADALGLEYPFMASIGRLSPTGNYFHSCGAALISDRFVVTAAHCSDSVDPAESAVLLGSSDPQVDGHKAMVKSIQVHPNWGERISDGHDMAVWELRERLNLSELGLHTVDMLTPETQHLATPTLLATTIGWGVSDNESSLLQEVHVPLASVEACAIAYPQVGSFETQICAGAIGGGLDSCQGDSGGPLLVRDLEGTRWMHAGVTSWGDGCGLADKPGIYGRTSTMSSWAKSQVREYSPAYLVELGSRNVSLDFPEQSTLRPMIGGLEEGRWALSQMDLPGIEDGATEPNKSLALRYFLFTESFGAGLSFACEMDPDGPGEIQASVFDCQEGPNQVPVPGYDEGAYMLTLKVSGEGVTRTRKELVTVGTLSSTEVEGALSSSDDRDVDFNDGVYYIDYYEIVGEAGVLSLLEVDASFFLQVGIYDADTRTAAEGGGALEVVSAGQSASLNIVLEEGKRYLVGISSQGEQATGSYTLRVLNNGTPTEASLP